VRIRPAKGRGPACAALWRSSIPTAGAYECNQSHSNAVTLNVGQAIVKAVECNLVEEDRPVAYQGCSLQFPILPYEIKTFKVWF
jgi:Glycosyl hydrolases family 38 C-terminal beta sandwich domain